MPLSAESAAVPTVTDLTEKWGLRKEALRSLSTTEKEAALSASFDRGAAALGKRATRPIVIIDDWIKSVMCREASSMLLGWRRGFNPRAGQDAWITDELKRIDQDWEDIRTGKVEVYFVDSTPAVAEQGPRGGGDVTADAWVKGGCGPCGSGCH